MHQRDSTSTHDSAAGPLMARVLLPGPACPARTPEDVWDAVLAYRPTSVEAHDWLAVRPFVLDVIAKMRPKTYYSAYKNLWVLAAYAVWAHKEGVPLDVEAVLHPQRVEHYTLTALGGTPTAGSYSSRLAQIGRATTRRAPWPPLTDIAYKRALRDPYSGVEMNRWEQLEARQPTAAQQRIFTCVFRTCGGAGTTPGECERVTANDLFRADGHLWLRVHGDRARVIPVALDHAEALEALAERYPTGTLLGTNPDAKNSLALALKRLVLDKQASSLSPQRLRTTWLTQRLANGTPLPDLLEWAGLTYTTWIADVVPHLPQDNADAVVRAVAPRQAS